MCGIIGYVGSRPCEELILGGLERLEYRGYDSAGMVLIDDAGFTTVRAVGNLAELRKAAAGSTSTATAGMGHTRWATHGRVTEANAHPHADASGRISVVMNGIIENYARLRSALQDEGVVFLSETDTEVIPHLIAKHYAGDLVQAVRDADGVLYTRAGLEIGVAATKTHVAQVMALALLALKLGQVRHTLTGSGVADLGEDIRRLPGLVADYLASPAADAAIAAGEKYAERPFFLYLGRHVGMPVSYEGALKLKEISYVPTEAYPAGEMKHGPIALLDDGSPVVVVATDGHVFDKVVSNIQEVRARGAQVIAVATEGNEEIAEHADDVLFVPRTLPLLSSVLAVVPLQLFAYAVARARGLNVDQPRNLAKTVTVE